MKQMVDPMDGFNSFQQAFNHNLVELHRCTLSPELVIHVDEVPDGQRFSYAKIIGNEVLAMAMFVPAERIQGIYCFSVGYAVAEKFRGQGLAKEILEKSIAELKHGFGKHGVKNFYLEAIINDQNKASQAIAAQLISDSPESCTDAFSGHPAIAYVRLIDTTV